MIAPQLHIRGLKGDLAAPKILLGPPLSEPERQRSGSLMEKGLQERASTNVIQS